MSNNYNEFEALLNEYLPPEDKGRVKVVAKISSYDRNFAYLDAANQPTAIRVKADELDGFTAGDEIDIILMGETEDGEFLIGSRRRLDMEEGMKIIERALDTKEILTCKIVKRINGGYILEFMKQQGFLPNSLSEISMKDAEGSIGKEIQVIVKDVKPDKKGKRVTFSKKDITMLKNAEELATVKVGDIVSGEVSDVLEFGLNVRIGSLRGFVHISEVSWKKIDVLKDVYKVADAVTCKVVNIDNEKKTLKLSIKALTRNPWEVAAETVKIDDIIEGKVTRTAPYGIFVEVTPGVEGLVHASDFTWNKKKINMSDFAKIGDVVKVKVLEFDTASRKLKLGMKQLSENPWTNASETFAVGKKLSGKVLDVKNFGIFVEVEKGVDAFVHTSDLAWPGDETPKYKIGDVVEFVVLELNKEDDRIKGSVKALAKSPWDKVVEIYKVGDIIEKEIKTIMDFGMFVTLEKGVDGFIPTQLASKEFVKNLKDKFSVGQKVKAEIIEIDRDKKKIKLSIKKIENESEKREEKDLIEKYGVSESK